MSNNNANKVTILNASFFCLAFSIAALRAHTRLDFFLVRFLHQGKKMNARTASGN